ncbi:MAG: hypothetical protein ACOX36_08080 [Saccharofermentanales bacterium]|jgi:hypothetical protein
MKRCSVLLVTVFIVLSLAGCNKNQSPRSSDTIRPVVSDIANNITTVTEHVFSTLTMAKVKELAIKGNALSWSDFKPYKSRDIGSGLHIFRYEVDADYYLLIGGIPDSEPIYIRLVSVNDQDDYIDIRTEDIDVFLNRAATSDDIFEDAPALTVSTWNSSIEAMMGTTSWGYDKGDGTWSGVDIDCLHPLDSNTKEYMPVLQVALTSNSAENPIDAVLQFSIAPDTITVCCWSDIYWGNTSAEGEPVPVRDFTIALKDGGYIYEVFARWDSSDKYEGTASYSFYAVPVD